MIDSLLLDDQCMLILHDLADTSDSRLGYSYEEALPKLLRLASHMCILADHRDLTPTRSLEWHIKMDALGILYAYRFVLERNVGEAHRYMVHCLNLYAEGKRRYERKAAWLSSRR